MSNPLKIITTEQAPSSKPVSVSKILSTEWQTFIDVPQYDVPLVGFGSSRRIAPGVCEPSAPVFFTNVGNETQIIDVRVIKAYRPLDQNVTELTINGEWLGGEGYVPGANIYLTTTPVERNADPLTAPYAVVNVGSVGSLGEVETFTVIANALGETVFVDGIEQTVVSDQGVFPQQAMYQVAVDDGGGNTGTGFVLIPDRNDLSEMTNVLTIAHQLRVEPNDVMLLPLNGQFFMAGELLQMRASSPGNVHAHISFTEGQAEEDQIYF